LKSEQKFYRANTAHAQPAWGMKVMETVEKIICDDDVLRRKSKVTIVKEFKGHDRRELIPLGAQPKPQIQSPTFLIKLFGCYPTGGPTAVSN